MNPVRAGQLKFGQVKGLVVISPKIGPQAHCIILSNMEGGYPNSCENIRAEIVLKFLHTGEKHWIAGLFCRTDGERIASEPAQRILLRMLETCELLLLCQDPIDREFRTMSRWPFHPESESRLEFGDWRLEIAAFCDSEPAVRVAYDVRLKPDLSSIWTPFQYGPPKAPANKQSVGGPCVNAVASPGERDAQNVGDLSVIRQRLLISRLAVPGGITWKDVAIRFLSERQFQASAKGITLPPTNFEEAGFADRRSKRARKPTEAWTVLIALAREGGSLKRPSFGARNRPAFEKRIEEIRERLKTLFGLDSDPFHPLDHEEYRLIPKISFYE
jgi:hypothetical protein